MNLFRCGIFATEGWAVVGSDSFFRVGRGGSELMVGYNPLFLLDKINDLTIESIYVTTM